jgi:hypothetical protein
MPQRKPRCIARCIALAHPQKAAQRGAWLQKPSFYCVFECSSRAWRAKTWAGVWRANGFSRGTIDALLRAEIDSNRRLLGLTRKGLRDIEGIGDSRVREIEAYREQFRGEDA